MRDERTIEGYWEDFLNSTSRDAGLSYYFCGSMGPTEVIADMLVTLIQSGEKTATTSCLSAYHTANEPLPKVGDLSIVTDWNGSPKCIIETIGIPLLYLRISG